MAKIITERHEIAKAINFGTYPVVRIECKITDKNCYRVIDGGNVKVGTVKRNGELNYEKCSISLFEEEYANDGHKHMNIGAHAICLSSSFDVSNVDEMAKWANTPKIKAGDDVAFVLIGKLGVVVIARVEKTISFCQTSAVLEDGASEKIAEIAWDIAVKG